ncbi:MAG: hypothetical protein ACE5HZ_08645 [Fidelibacterota bacterium]
MPLLTRWFIKLGLVYLVLSLALAVLLAGRGLLDLPASVLALVHVFLHLFMVGWVTQLIFGVAHWMFPKYSREKPRGNESIGWVSLVTLNLGLVMRAVAEPAYDLGYPGPFGVLLIFSSFFQWLGAAAFVVNLWGRVKEK